MQRVSYTKRQQMNRRYEPEQSKRLACVTFLVILSVHVSLLGYSATVHSPVSTEVELLTAGLSHLSLGEFGLYRVNPPLVRTVAAIPVAYAAPRLGWSLYDAHPHKRSEYVVGATFARNNKRDIQRFITLGRWACIGFSAIGAIVCFRWASKLYGPASGVLSSTLWCFSPMILGHGHLLTSDVGAAALGVVAAYAFWMWLQDPRWSRALFAGVVLGLAELTKLTLIVFFGLWPVIWIIWRVSGSRSENHSVAQCFLELMQVCLILSTALYCLNAGYLFDESCQPLEEYSFASHMLGGNELERRTEESDNRFSDTWLADIPLPLPRHYVCGIDQQRRDFESGVLSYLQGQWKTTGWWYYYLYALAVKVPLGYWGIAILAIVRRLLDPQPGAWRDECTLTVPLLTVLILVSSQTGLNHHARYVLPVFPFAFIWMASVARTTTSKNRTLPIGLSFLLIWSIGSSLWIFPHSLSYFNDLVGGPRNGSAHLLHSNIDWGQDYVYLQRWVTSHPAPQLPRTALAGGCIVSRDDIASLGVSLSYEPLPGCYILSVNEIHSHSKEYHYFLHFEPTAMAGYSICIYVITLEDANRVRRELGLPELPEDWEEAPKARNRVTGW